MDELQESIKGKLQNIVGDDLASKIMEANFPEETEHEKEMRFVHGIFQKLIDKESVSKEEKKVFKKITGMKI